jgi:glycosyltransferase involved in cell wall biosynthesis
MRVLLQGLAGGVGGAQTAFRRLADFFLDDGFEVGIVAISMGDGELPPRQRQALLSRVPHSSAGPPGKLAKAASLGRAALSARQFSPDVFVSIGLARTANFIARALRPSCFKLVQDFIFDRPVDDPLLKSAASVFDGLAVQTSSMVASFRNAGFRGCPINWLPCFPDAPVEGCARQPRSWDGSARLAYFGRLERHKGIDLLLEAMAGLDKAESFTFDVWGSGSEERRLAGRREALGLARAVSFKGPYPAGPEGARLMCEYDALVLPSTGCEGLPLILLEAMAYGIPFLATDVGAVRDCCEDNPDATLVDPNVDALGQGLRKALGMMAAQEFRPERLREYYRRRFSYEVMADRWRQFLRAPEAFFA